VTTPASAVVLYDGVCNLCNAWVRFVIRHDPAGRFRFAPQQSIAGQTLIRARLPAMPNLSTVILLNDEAVYTESSAVLEICARLDLPWSWLASMRAIPQPMRDSAYRFIVRHRYRWFGRTEVCQIPAADYRSRFLG
jgi:predicted DCC family thiol-disulfide oxidoreductase YuxK